MHLSFAVLRSFHQNNNNNNNENCGALVIFLASFLFPPQPSINVKAYVKEKYALPIGWWNCPTWDYLNDFQSTYAIIISAFTKNWFNYNFPLHASPNDQATNRNIRNANF